jgi:hypothetical protein
MRKPFLLLVLLAWATIGCGKTKPMQDATAASPPRKAIDPFAADPLSDPFTMATVEKVETPAAKKPVNVASIGKTLDLGTIAVIPTKVAVVTANAESGTFGRTATAVEGVLMVEFTIANQTEGQVFRPSTMMTATDNFGNVSSYESDTRFKDEIYPDELQPGQSFKMRELVKLKNKAAKSLTVEFSTTCDNKEGNAKWSLQVELPKP